MSQTLKPCPFCGSEAEIEREGSRRHSCIVACTDCGARHEGPDEGERSGAAWNRRAAILTVAVPDLGTQGGPDGR